MVGGRTREDYPGYTGRVNESARFLPAMLRDSRTWQRFPAARLSFLLRFLGQRAAHRLVLGTPCRRFRTPRTDPQRPGPPRNTSVRLVTFHSPKGAPSPYAGIMKTLVTKDALNRMALCVCFLSALPIVQGAAPITITMTADHWQTKENAEFLRQLGFYHGLMRLNSGRATLKDTVSDGTIEFDVNTIGRGMPGIAFRRQDENNFELLYLRPDPACPAFRACMQYTPTTHGVPLGDFFPRYRPLRENGWNHIKMVVFGQRMNVFVNDAPSPTLEVDKLEGDAMRGGLHFQGPATYANRDVEHPVIGSLSADPWRLSILG